MQVEILLNRDDFFHVNCVVMKFSTDQNEPPSIKALVLAGGTSKRMGQDKSQLKYHGQTQEMHTANLCYNLGLKTHISKKHNFEQDYIGVYPIIKDQVNNLGPLAAILAAFHTDSKSAWMVVACDLPFLIQDVLHSLILNRRPDKLATCFRLEKNDFPEPLITIYEPEMFPLINKFYLDGGSSPKQLLLQQDIHMLTLANESLLTNVNTIKEKIEAVKKLKE